MNETISSTTAWVKKHWYIVVALAVAVYLYGRSRAAKTGALTATNTTATIDPSMLGALTAGAGGDASAPSTSVPYATSPATLADLYTQQVQAQKAAAAAGAVYTIPAGPAAGAPVGANSPYNPITTTYLDTTGNVHITRAAGPLWSHRH